MNLDGKIALVTGGSRGIGKEIAISLSKAGAKVMITYNKQKEKADEVVDEITSLGGLASNYQMDVRSRSSVKKVILQCEKENSKLDILINSAGINKPTDFDKVTDDEWDEIFAINLKGVFICTQEALPLIRKSNNGSIVNIGSVSGQYGGPRTPHYAASKAGLISLSQVIARFAARDNIRCNTVAAGLISTNMADEGLKSNIVQKAAEGIILNRLGSTEEVANAVVFLASDESSYITAQTINVNGGLYF
tara:strand:- start:27 stop:773 length:747 start_codon:yes stop_codon:yes gene_type:complete